VTLLWVVVSFCLVAQNVAYIINKPTLFWTPKCVLQSVDVYLYVLFACFDNSPLVCQYNQCLFNAVYFCSGHINGQLLSMLQLLQAMLYLCLSLY